MAAATLLAACGGGGGVNSPGGSAPPVTTPGPTPTPAPAPAPTPTPTSADTAEYGASGAVVQAKAAYAYDRGVTGKGVTIAILDTGIDTSGREFAGRVSPDGTAFDQRIARCATCDAETIRFDVKDVTGHGTRVAGIAAAARDGVGVQGMAPDATILSLKISAPDLRNVTPTSGPVPEAFSANPALIAPAIRYGIERGAFVTSLSANGSATGSVATELHAAMDAVRQADRLLVQSVSNFTDEDSFTGQFAQNLIGSDLENRDWFLFAVGVDQNGNPRTSNGSAGPLADRMLAAGGVDVQTVDQSGGIVTETGNSFAAPAVAGAAALLKQYWPQLGGRAISRILLDTATDAGSPGVDAVFGVGLLNVENAMRAQAPASSFVAAQAVLTRYASLTMSAPFGGGAALRTKVGTMTVFDRYGRDFRMTGDAGVRTGGSRLLAGSMLPPADPIWLSASPTDARLGFAASVPDRLRGLGSARPAIASFSPAPGQSVTMGVNVAIGRTGGIAGSPLRGIGSAPVGVTSSWSGAGWSAGFASGRSRDARTALRTASFSTPSGFGFEVSDLVEQGRALGMAGGVDFGLGGARTKLASLTMRRAIRGVPVSARVTAGTTRIEGGSDMMRFVGPVSSSAFAIEAAQTLLGGSATLGLSSPLRVRRARATMLLPVSYDLASGALTAAAEIVDLAPTVRELDLEFGWSTALSSGSSLSLGIARAFDAGHVAGADDTAGFVTFFLR
ncbi:subtilisin family serine protease [Sphingomonas sp. PP-CC-3G-468]|nr:subtilisin family serine protease [Sphingomonas sp. PP-CC-3G-468]